MMELYQIVLCEQVTDTTTVLFSVSLNDERELHFLPLMHQSYQNELVTLVLIFY